MPGGALLDRTGALQYFLVSVHCQRFARLQNSLYRPDLSSRTGNEFRGLIEEVLDDPPRGGLLPTVAVLIGFDSSRPRFGAIVATDIVGMLVSGSEDELGVANVAELADMTVGVVDIGSLVEWSHYGCDNL